MFRFAPLLFIIIPLVELYVIITVGEMIGAFWTVILVILTAVIGVNLLRFQGMSTLMRAQRNMAQGQVPAMEMMEGIALAVAGVLLITPGFLTDTIGFLCLIPASRQAIIRYLMSRSVVQTGFTGSSVEFRAHSSTRGQYSQHSSTGSDPGKQKPGQQQSGQQKNTGRTIEGEFRRED